VSTCRIDGEIAASRWAVRCAPGIGQSGPTLSATLSVKSGRPIGGRLARLELSGGTALSNVELIKPSATAGFALQLSGRLPRTAEGHALAGLSFRRSATDPEAGEVVLDIREDFAAVERAVASLVESTFGAMLFNATAIPRAELFAALLTQLGAARPQPCCKAADALPPPRLEVPAAAPGERPNTPMDSSLQGFYPYCATCHQSAESFPPNFLSGNGAQVAARLRQCAPRLYVRLAMADLAPDMRDKTPMPPEGMLPAFATDVAGWKNSLTRVALLAQVSDWLRAETGRPPSLNELLAGGYEALRPCLPTP
jgi:hypothetical protein